MLEPQRHLNRMMQFVHRRATTPSTRMPTRTFRLNKRTTRAEYKCGIRYRNRHRYRAMDSLQWTGAPGCCVRNSEGNLHCKERQCYWKRSLTEWIRFLRRVYRCRYYWVLAKATAVTRAFTTTPDVAVARDNTWFTYGPTIQL